MPYIRVMRRLIAALGVVAALLAAAFLVMEIVGRRAEGRASAALAEIEPAAAFAARYPDVTGKNASAAALERLAAPLSIELDPATRTAQGLSSDDERWPDFSGWSKEQGERPSDAIDPVPAAIEQWLFDRERPLAEVVSHLRTQAPPRWPIARPIDLTSDGPPSIPWTPNLLGHMRLMRVLSVASLRAESRGEHARAWEIQEAVWKEAQALYARPEVISRLVAIAGLRLIASNVRKLEPPAPGWLKELEALNIRAGVFDSQRYDLIHAEERIAQHRASANWRTSLMHAIYAPVDRLTWADLVRANAKELHRLTVVDPCSIEVEQTLARVREDMSPVARTLIQIQTPNLVEAMVRAASTEIAIDGSVRILEAKAALAAGQPVPAAPPTCANGTWIFESAAGTERVRFTAQVPTTQRAGPFQLPTEFVFAR